MIDINWNIFNIKNPDKGTAFQNMCKHLFCRELSISGYDLKINYNNPGLETAPVLHDGKYHGFQCKYVDPASSEGNFYRQVNKSLNIAYKLYKDELDIVYIYTNKNIKPNITETEIKNLSKKSPRLQIINNAIKNKVDIEWIINDKLESIINKPENNDIATFYFSEGRELEYLDNAISIEDNTFLQSKTHIELPIKNFTYKDIKNVSRKNNNTIVLGHAGSGKTVLMKKIFSTYRDNFLKNYYKKMEKKYFFPVFIRLRECIGGSLEDLIRQRLKDYRIDKTINTYKYLYILDGLDEISSNYIGRILNYVQSLKSDKSTYGIILSSRTDSFNLSFLYQSFPNIEKIEMLPLKEEDIKEYFQVRNNLDKTDKLNILLKNNKSLIIDMDDVFSVSLLWDMIEKIDESTTKIDLCEQSVNRIVNNYSKISEINLPEPKSKHLKDLFCKASYQMKKSNLLNIDISTLQLLIHNKFDKLNYEDVNRIIYCLSELFFEKVDHSEQVIFSFRHRRFQEYFLCKKILQVFLKQPCILRELQLLNNKDFIINIFLKYGLKESIKRKDMLLYLSLRFFETFLGPNYLYGYKDKYIGTKSDYCYGGVNPYEQNEFIDAIVNQEEENIFILLDSLQLDKHDPTNYIVISKISILFHKRTGINIYHELIKRFVSKKTDLEEILYLSFEYLYINKFFKNEDICTSAYNNCIKGLKIDPNTDFVITFDEDSKSVLSFYRFLLKYNISFLCTIIDDIDEYHLEYICYLLLRDEYIYYTNFKVTKFIQLKDVITLSIESREIGLLLINTLIFYNLLTGKNLGVDLLETRFGKVNQNNFSVWHRNIEANQYLAIVLKKSDSLYNNDYNLGVDIKQITLTSISIELILKDIINVVKKCNYSSENWFQYNDSTLIGAILATFPFKIDDIRAALNTLFKYDSVINLFAVYYKIFTINKALFNSIANESILDSICKESKDQLSYYDHNSNGDYMCAAMYASFNIDKSNWYIQKGLNNSICRPSFKKEDLIDYQLPCLLRMLAANRWYKEIDLEIIVSRIFEMLKIMSDTTTRGADLQEFKKVLIEYLPSSPLLNERRIYEIKIPYEKETKEKDNEVYSKLEIGEVTLENLKRYYECKNMNIDYETTETWKNLINFEIDYNDDLRILFSVLKNASFPEPCRGDISKYFPLITAILLKKPETRSLIINFILEEGGRSGLINIIKAYIHNSNVTEGKIYFEALLFLCEMLVYPVSPNKAKEIKNVDLLSTLIFQVENSSKKDWYINVNSERIFKCDPNIRIIAGSYEERRPYFEEWATKYPVSKAFLNKYYLYYNNNLIKTYSLVSVDDGRALLPIPTPDTNQISRKDYKIALILDEGDMQKYIQRSGLVIE